MQALGLLAEDFEYTVEVWPENWPAWTLFAEVSGQWRFAGMAGIEVALDYTPLFMRMERMGLSDSEWNDLFADVRVLEKAALSTMAKERKK